MLRKEDVRARRSGPRGTGARINVGGEPPSVPQSGSELERFLDLALDLLVIAGFDGYLKRVNPAYERTLGYPIEELLARPMLAVVHPDDVESVGTVLSGLLEGEDVIGFENRVICADGSARWLEWNTRAVPERGIVYGVGRDVTERRRADAELENAQRMIDASREELRVLADEQAALRRVAILVARGVPPAEVFPAVAAEVSVLFGSDIAAIVRFEDDGTVTVLGDVGGPHEPGKRVTLDGGYVVHTVRETRGSARFDTDDPPAGREGTLVRSASGRRWRARSSSRASCGARSRSRHCTARCHRLPSDGSRISQSSSRPRLRTRRLARR
jgi:PAS domain S-box-containing protein